MASQSASLVMSTKEVMETSVALSVALGISATKVRFSLSIEHETSGGNQCCQSSLVHNQLSVFSNK